ncbi:MAG: SRPBCC family protein [Candidatus Manganitrophus sp. SB1]|nr:SRPBCC family protein [Candidatus Manganitrophus morganii]
MEIKKAVTVLKSPEELYRYWRKFDMLPNFMKNLEAVTPLGDRRSHWRAKGPAAQVFEWDAEITEDQINERIAWRSLEGADVEQAGAVTFKKAPGDRGTEVRVRMEYNAPGGKLGAVAAKLIGEDPGTRVYEDLRRFKALMETGEIPVNNGEPARPK